MNADVVNTMNSNVSFPGISSEHDGKTALNSKVNGQFRGNALSNRQPKMAPNAFRLSEQNVAVKATHGLAAASGQMVGVIGSSVLSGNVLQT